MSAAQDYSKQAKDFCRFRGLSDGEFPIIDRHEHPKQWEAWIAFFASRGMPASASLMRDGRNTWTVPAMWPQEFDASFVLRDPFPSQKKAA